MNKEEVTDILDDSVEMVRSNKGGLKVIHKGYMYTIHKQKFGRIRWRCSQRTLRCRGSITTGLGSPVINLPHNHVPDMHAVALARCRSILPDDGKTISESECPVDVIPLLSDSFSLTMEDCNSSENLTAQESSSSYDSEMCLRWNSHHANIQNVFPALMNEERFVDVTLAVERQFIRCHKLVLSSCSNYFDEMLKSSDGYQQTIIYLSDFQFWQVKGLVDFMYKGEVNVDQSRLESFLQAAENLQIKGLTRVNSNSESKIPESKKESPEKEFMSAVVPTTEPKVPKIPETVIKKEFKMTSPLLEDNGDEDYFPHSEYKKKNTAKKNRKRKISIPPDPSLLKHVKINLKGTKSRPIIKQPKFYSPDYPEYDPDRCVSPPNIASDPVFHINDIKLEPIDIESPQSPTYFEMNSLEAIGTGSEEISSNNKVSENTASASSGSNKKSHESTANMESVLEENSEKKSILKPLKKFTAKTSSCNSVMPITTIPITTMPITTIPITTKPITAMKTSTNNMEPAMKQKCSEMGEIPIKRENNCKTSPSTNSINSKFYENVEGLPRTPTDILKPLITVRNLSTTESVLKKFATSNLTSILKKGNLTNKSPVMVRKLNKPAILRHSLGKKIAEKKVIEDANKADHKSSEVNDEEEEIIPD